MRPRRRAADSERGAILVITSVGIVALLGFAAIAVDLGDSRQRSRHHQSATDMTATAAAMELSSNAADTNSQAQAHLTGKDFAERNLSTSLMFTGCRTSAPGRQCYTDGDMYVEITTPHAGLASFPAHQQVEVTVCSQSPGMLGPAVGLTPSEVCRSAVGLLDETIANSPAIMALNPTASEAFHLEGVAVAVGVNGGLVSNSSSGSAFHMKDNTDAISSGDGASVLAVGGASLAGSYSLSPAPTTGAPVTPDPWASVVEPTVSSSGSYNSSTKTFTPGSYGSIKIDKPGTYVFQPGIYKFTGEFKIEGAGVRILADNVLWYFAGSGRANWGSGTNYIRISAMGPSTYYGGNSGAFPPLAIFQSRSNSNAFHIGDDIRIGNRSGTSCTVTNTAGIAGGVYIPNSQLRVRGNTGSGLCTEGAPVVADRVHIQETGLIQGEGYSSGVSSRTTRLAG